MNIPRSPVVDRATSTHNALAHVVETYGKLLMELGAENHALRAEVMALRAQSAELEKANAARLEEQRAKLAEIEKKNQDSSLRDLAAFEACG